MSKTFRAWEVEQTWLLPPSVLDLVPKDHVAHFVREVVRSDLNLDAIHAAYTEARGQPPYHPAMMTALLLYGYSRGVYSSRRIERACVERVDFMAVTAMAKPDHATIARFRLQHLEALEGLFVQVLRLCREAGIAKLGHVALDGTKMGANASKRKAMSYARMKEAVPKLRAEVKAWLSKADEIDRSENKKYGRKRGDEMPAWVANKQKRLQQIKAAKERLEEQAKKEAERVEAERSENDDDQDSKPGGRPPKNPSGVPKDKAQSNFTDPESRIMKTNNGFEQAYNCQLTVDAESQVIVSHDVIGKQNDVDELKPALEQIKATLGVLPDEFSADAGYCSEANLALLEKLGIRGYVATGRQKHGTDSATGRLPKRRRRERQGRLTKQMRAKLRQGGYRSRYRLRKQTVEPVIGQIKEARGFRRFLMRGLEKVGSEWSLLSTAHNLLKLFQSQKVAVYA